MTPKQRAAFFRDHNGICYLCTRKIAPGEEWEIEHEHAKALGGSEGDNRRLAHKDCHAVKTKSDVKKIRKADRAGKIHAGLRKRNSFPANRSGPFKVHMDGTVSRRSSHHPHNGGNESN